jgi:adenine-specific DNA-methyltransferase
MTIDRAHQALLWDEPVAAPAHSRPTEAAYWRGSIASRSRLRDEQRRLGQFMTPPPIARFIAQRMVEGRSWSGRVVRMLDPAAGSGVLAAALVEALVTQHARPAAIELLLCDIDPSMGSLLDQCAAELKAVCGDANVGLTTLVQHADFLLSPLACDAAPAVDAVIANPPYFKLARNDRRVVAHEGSVHGQPNIYALFMSACAAILRPGGAYGFITPRSWTNGNYFAATRRALARHLSIDALHLFDSRQAHFEGDAILQEALIVWGTAAAEQRDVVVSSSHGIADLDERSSAVWPAGRVLGRTAGAPIVLPNQAAPGSVASIEHWPLRLADIGLRVQTGPVVGFRARAHLRLRSTTTSVPMLWMPHVRRSHVDWPRAHKAEHIESNDASAWMLVRNEPMVLLRRFSPKEDERRVTATSCEAQLPGESIGLENHLNVIRGIDEPMSVPLARGLAAWLNSHVVDEHLRQRLGSTQVNAVELRALPVPDAETLERLGCELPQRPSLEQIDARVSQLVSRFVAAGGARAA